MHIEAFQGVFPLKEYIASADSFFQTIREDYPTYAANGFFSPPRQPACYIYRIEEQARHFTGLVAGVHIGDFSAGLIRRHEQTIAEREQLQLQLSMRRKANVKPVLLTYANSVALDEWLAAYVGAHASFFEMEFKGDHQVHRFWAVEGAEELAVLRQLFEEQVPVTYIADGHHRIASQERLYERYQGASDNPFAYLLAAFFPASELVIHNFNRVIDTLKDISPTQLMARLSAVFDFEVLPAPRQPAHKHELTMLFEKSWYALRWRQSVLAAQPANEVVLDVDLLNRLVLQEILQIADARTDSRVLYIEGPKGLDGLKRLVGEKRRRIGFCLFPVLFEEFVALSKAEADLPPKSTWFEPRMKNGLVVQNLLGDERAH